MVSPVNSTASDGHAFILGPKGHIAGAYGEGTWVVQDRVNSDQKIIRSIQGNIEIRTQDGRGAQTLQSRDAGLHRERNICQRQCPSAGARLRVGIPGKSQRLLLAHAWW